MQPRFLILIALIVIAASMFPQPIYACSPTSPPPGGPTPTPDTLQERVQQTSIIFEGTVIATEDRTVTTVQVTRYFNGAGPATVQILGFGSGADCLPFADIGAHGIFYTAGDPYDQLSLQPGSRIDQANDTTVNTIIGLVGHTPLAPSSEPISPAPLRQARVWLAPIAIAGLVLILGMIGLIVWRRRK